MALLKNQTSANLDLDFFGAGGGGGGGGPAISTIVLTTSSITTSTITANGTIYDSLTGDPTKPEAWSVGVDNNNFAYEVLSGSAAVGAYIDIRAESAPNTIVDYVRIQGYQGGGQIGYAPAALATPEVGFRFFSSINGGVGGTYLVTPGDVFPLGGQLIPFASLNPIAPAGQGAVITPGFSTIVGHTYAVSFQVSEAVTGVPNPQDRTSYQVAGQVLDTISHTEISTLQSANPRGRCVNGVFVAPLTSAQVAIGLNTGSAQSTLLTMVNTNLNGVLLRDLGPTNLIIAP